MCFMFYPMEIMVDETNQIRYNKQYSSLRREVPLYAVTKIQFKTFLPEVMFSCCVKLDS